MKKIQYKFDMAYTNEEVLNVLGSLLKVVVNDVHALKKGKAKLTPKDFALYPMNAAKISKLRKVLLVSGSAKGEVILDGIDSKFMTEVDKNSFKVVREVASN